MGAATQDGARRLQLYDLTLELSSKKKVSDETRALLLNALDLSDSEHQPRFISFLHREVNALKTKPESARAKRTFALALQLEAARIGDAHKSDDEVLRDLIGLLPTSQKVVVIKRIGQLVATSKNARKSKVHFDERLFELFLGQVERVPSREYLPELAALDVPGYRNSPQTHIERRVALLNTGLALVKADPSSAGAVFKALERWIRDESVFSPEWVFSSDRENPRAKKLRWISTLQQFKALRQ